MSSSKKVRIDLLIQQRGLAASRQRAKSLIMSGKILVDDRPVDKPGILVSEDARIINKEPDMPYVSRGGLKLAHALESAHVDVSGWVCLDVGASTGGFTDCLLQKGAARVWAVDVGYGQFDWKLRQNPRVTVIERTNIRYAPPELFPEPFDLVAIDVSFISLKIVIPAAIPFLKPDGRILALIKPQFEVGKGQVGKGGVVKDARLHQSVISELTRFFDELGLVRKALLPSPILGPKGNREFLILLNQNRRGDGDDN